MINKAWIKISQLFKIVNNNHSYLINSYENVLILIIY
jgi:hypothetical protein